MINDKRVIIIHGTNGTPDENWFPWLKHEVELLGIQAIVPKFPTPIGQNLNNWTLAFQEQCGDLTRNTFLIGHSLGVGFILNLLESSKQPVAGIHLVSGFTGLLEIESFDLLNESFTDKGFNWAVIRRNAGTVYIYNSDDDPYVPLAKGVELANNLQSELTIIRNGGHINSDSGYTSFPKVLEDLKCGISIAKLRL